VIFRYGLNSSIVWSEPAAVILMGWFIFLGAAVGIREGYHLSFDILLYVLPPRGKAVLHSISDLVGGRLRAAWSGTAGSSPGRHVGRDHAHARLLGRRSTSCRSWWAACSW
jgi:hypothetical protein